VIKVNYTNSIFAIVSKAHALHFLNRFAFKVICAYVKTYLKMTILIFRSGLKCIFCQQNLKEKL
jgi:hypothetical protein